MIRSSMTKSDQKPIFQHFYYDYLFRYSSFFKHNINMLFSASSSSSSPSFSSFKIQIFSERFSSIVMRLWNRFTFKINNLRWHWSKKNQSTEYTNDSFLFPCWFYFFFLSSFQWKYEMKLFLFDVAFSLNRTKPPCSSFSALCSINTRWSLSYLPCYIFDICLL